LVTYDERGVSARTGEIAGGLAALLADPRYAADAVDASAIASTSAHALAGRLAGVLNQCRA